LTPEPTTQPKENIVGDFVVGRILGRGAFSVVRLGHNKATGEKVAVKTYEKYRLIDHKRSQAV
jgi:serine/threonine protein kinase